MRWPWRRYEPDHDGLNDARARLAKAQRDEVVVSQLSEALRKKQRENHFGPRIAAALREHRQ